MTTTVAVILVIAGICAVCGGIACLKEGLGNPKVCVIAIIVGILCLVICVCVPISSGSGSSSGGTDYSSSSTKEKIDEECYVCGKEATIKYGSHYYCSTHYAYVKVVDEELNG